MNEIYSATSKDAPLSRNHQRSPWTKSEGWEGETIYKPNMTDDCDITDDSPLLSPHNVMYNYCFQLVHAHYNVTQSTSLPHVMMTQL